MKIKEFKIYQYLISMIMIECRWRDDLDESWDMSINILI